MKQKTQGLKAWLLTLMLVMAGMNAWGDTATSSSLSSKSTSAQTVEAGKTITYKCSSYNSYDNPARIYKNSTFTVSSTDGVTITKIELTTPSDYPANAFTVTGSYSATTTAGTWTGEATSVVFTAGAQVRVSAITVTYSAGESTASAPTLTAGGVFTTESMDVTITNGETGATVYYTTDGSAPTTSSESFTGASKTINISATTTVKAMAVIDGKANSSVVAATYTKEASIANTAATAYTVAEAKALIDANSSQLKNTKVYVKGTISKIDKINTDNSITYWLDDNAFEVFKGLDVDSVAFTSINDIKVGGTVVVYGLITKYGTTYEFSQCNWLASYVAPAASKNTATMTLGTYKSALTTGDDDEYTVTYDGDATVEVTSSDETVAEAIIVDGTVMVSAKKADTTTITVSAAETENYYAANKSYTLTVTDPAPAAELPFSFDGGKGDIASKTGMTQTGIGNDYSASPKLKFDEANDNLIVNYASTARNITYKIKGNSTTSTTVFDVMESADGKTYTSVHSFSGNVPSTATSYTDKLKSDSRYVKFVYTTKSGNVALGAISISNEKADAGLAFEQSTYRFYNYTEGLAVKATSSKGSTGAITYSVEEGEETEIILDESTGEVYAESDATFTIKATIEETEDYKETTATCKVIFKSRPVANSIIVATTEDGKCFAMTNTANGSYMESVQICKAGDKYYVISNEVLETIKYATATSEGKTTIVSMGGQYLQATAAKNVSFTDEEYQWTNDGEKLTAATSSYGTLQYNVSSPRFTTYSNKSGQYATIVSLDDVVVGGYALTVSDAGYATLCLPFDATAPEGVKVYTGTYNSDRSTVTLNAVEDGKIAMGQGYIVKAEAATYAFVKTEEEVVAPDGNALVGVTEATDIAAKLDEDGGTAYVLYNGTEVEFCKTTAGTLAANKAYLWIPGESSDVAQFISVVWGDEEATGLSELNASDAAADGKFIENGQMVIVKNGVKYNTKGQMVK